MCRPSLEECRNKSVGEVMQTVVTGSIPLDYGPWLSMSPAGLDLMRALTHREPERRITAKQVKARYHLSQRIVRPAVMLTCNVTESLRVPTSETLHPGRSAHAAEIVNHRRNDKLADACAYCLTGAAASLV